jgi:hypothetical protein
MKYGWIKYRFNFAYGSSEWHYREEALAHLVKSKRFVRENCLAHLEDEYNYSDKYRGIEFEIVKLPPKEILINKARAARIAAASSLIRAKRYEQQAKKAKAA